MANPRPAGWLLLALTGMLCSGGLQFPSPASAHQATSVSPPEQRERIAASFVLALGRIPSPKEMEDAVNAPPKVAELLARHREHLRRNGDARAAVAAKAMLDAFGPGATVPTGASADHAAIYTERLAGHVEWLAAHPAEYDATIHRAYRLVLERNAYDVELDYWRRQPALPFALLAACIDDWARRNQPGLTATTGVAAVSVNSPYLETVRLSPAVAAEARAAAGLPPADDRALGATPDRHVVAAKAARLVSVGGIHFVAAGGAALTEVSR